MLMQSCCVARFICVRLKGIVHPATAFVNRAGARMCVICCWPLFAMEGMRFRRCRALLPNRHVNIIRCTVPRPNRLYECLTDEWYEYMSTHAAAQHASDI
jgi:hypothetical protein